MTENIGLESSHQPGQFYNRGPLLRHPYYEDNRVTQSHTMNDRLIDIVKEQLHQLSTTLAALEGQQIHSHKTLQNKQKAHLRYGGEPPDERLPNLYPIEHRGKFYFITLHKSRVQYFLLRFDRIWVRKSGG